MIDTRRVERLNGPYGTAAAHLLSAHPCLKLPLATSALPEMQLCGTLRPNRALLPDGGSNTAGGRGAARPAGRVGSGAACGASGARRAGGARPGPTRGDPRRQRRRRGSGSRPPESRRAGGPGEFSYIKHASVCWNSRPRPCYSTYVVWVFIVAETS